MRIKGNKILVALAYWRRMYEQVVATLSYVDIAELRDKVLVLEDLLEVYEDSVHVRPVVGDLERQLTLRQAGRFEARLVYEDQAQPTPATAARLWYCRGVVADGHTVEVTLDDVEIKDNSLLEVLDGT